MVLNTSLRSINSASEHGNMVTPTSENSSAMYLIQTRDKQLWEKNHTYRYTLLKRCQHGHDYRVYVTMYSHRAL